MCYHSNETSLSVHVRSAIGFSAFNKVNLKILTKFDFQVVITGSERVKDLMKD